MILTFGDHKDKDLSEVPDGYVKWLAKPKYSGAFYENARSTDLKWKVPLAVKMAAREELDKRGWELKGERWVLKE